MKACGLEARWGTWHSFGLFSVFGTGFVAFYVSSVVVFAFVLFCKVSSPIVYILPYSVLYVFGITSSWYIANVFRYLDLHEKCLFLE